MMYIWASHLHTLFIRLYEDLYLMIKVVWFIVLHFVDNDMQNSLKIFHKKKNQSDLQYYLQKVSLKVRLGGNNQLKLYMHFLAFAFPLSIYGRSHQLKLPGGNGLSQQEFELADGKWQK